MNGSHHVDSFVGMDRFNMLDKALLLNRRSVCVCVCVMQIKVNYFQSLSQYKGPSPGHIIL